MEQSDQTKGTNLNSNKKIKLGDAKSIRVTPKHCKNNTNLLLQSDSFCVVKPRYPEFEKTHILILSGISIKIFTVQGNKIKELHTEVFEELEAFRHKLKFKQDYFYNNSLSHICLNMEAIQNKKERDRLARQHQQVYFSFTLSSEGRILLKRQTGRFLNHYPFYTSGSLNNHFLSLKGIVNSASDDDLKLIYGLLGETGLKTIFKFTHDVIGYSRFDTCKCTFQAPESKRRSHRMTLMLPVKHSRSPIKSAILDLKSRKFVKVVNLDWWNDLMESDASKLYLRLDAIYDFEHDCLVMVVQHNQRDLDEVGREVLSVIKLEVIAIDNFTLYDGKNQVWRHSVEPSGLNNVALKRISQEIYLQGTFQEQEQQDDGTESKKLYLLARPDYRPVEVEEEDVICSDYIRLCDEYNPSIFEGNQLGNKLLVTEHCIYLFDQEFKRLIDFRRYSLGLSQGEVLMRDGLVIKHTNGLSHSELQMIDCSKPNLRVNYLHYQIPDLKNNKFIGRGYEAKVGQFDEFSSENESNYGLDSLSENEKGLKSLLNRKVKVRGINDICRQKGTEGGISVLVELLDTDLQVPRLALLEMDEGLELVQNTEIELSNEFIDKRKIKFMNTGPKGSQLGSSPSNRDCQMEVKGGKIEPTRILELCQKKDPYNKEFILSLFSATPDSSGQLEAVSKFEGNIRDCESIELCYTTASSIFLVSWKNTEEQLVPYLNWGQGGRDNNSTIRRMVFWKFSHSQSQLTLAKTFDCSSLLGCYPRPCLSTNNTLMFQDLHNICTVMDEELRIKQSFTLDWGNNIFDPQGPKLPVGFSSLFEGSRAVISLEDGRVYLVYFKGEVLAQKIDVGAPVFLRKGVDSDEFFGLDADHILSFKF